MESDFKLNHYRRTKGFRYWHWFTNCPHWPVHDFDGTLIAVPREESCPHCQQLETDGRGERPQGA